MSYELSPIPCSLAHQDRSLRKNTKSHLAGIIEKLVTRRDSSSALEVYIGGPATPIAKQWDKYISNPNNKKTFCDFLTHSMCNLRQRHLRESTQLVIGGGFKDGERCVAIIRDSCVDVEDLKSNQEGKQR